MCPLIKLPPVGEALFCTADILTNVLTSNSTVFLQEVLTKFQSEKLLCVYPKFTTKF